MTSTRQEQDLAHQQEIEEDIARSEREERDERIKENYKRGQEIELGRECKQFWQSEVGRFILDRATTDTEDAKRKLASVKRSNYTNSYDFEAAIIELQQQAFIPELVWNWLNEAIRAATEAEQLITEREDTENEY